MCGRFTQQRPASELAEIFGAEPLVDDPGGHYNVAPTDDALVVVQRDERRGLTAYRWGLIPHWATEARVGSRMINARAETITSSPAFRDAFVRKRCLVPVDSFYEWKREGTVRQPYRVANPIAQRLKRESPFKATMMATLTNGAARSGYIPDDESFGKYTFEVLSSRLKPGCAESAIVNGILTLIDSARAAQ